MLEKKINSMWGGRFSFAPSEIMEKIIFQSIVIKFSLNIKKSYRGVAVENVKKMIEYYKKEV